MGLMGAMQGKEKQEELDKKKVDIYGELSEILSILCDKIGQRYECHVSFNLEISLIPNEKK